MKENRKSQGGLNAAVLVAIIAGLIILYIIFLPTSERENLIDDKTGGSQGNGGSTSALLKVFPGLLSVSSGLENEKKIPNIFLVETTNAKELEKINPFVVRNSWFNKQDKKIDFEIEDLANTGNVVLSFTAKKSEGTLMIKLNGATIFENDLNGGAAEPVRLGKILAKANSLEFSVSSSGAKFWTTNEYSLENVKILGDITDTTRQESANLFILTDSELQSMDKATLKFIPYCKNVKDLGALDIFVNNKKLFSSVPICDNAYKQSMPKSILNQDGNNIIFKTSKGSYSVEQIKISLEFKEPKLKTYFFEISSNAFNDIKRGSKSIQALIKFTDDKKTKRLKLDVNGHLETVDTQKQEFTRIINNKISEGNNFIRLEPFEDIEVAELRVNIV